MSKKALLGVFIALSAVALPLASFAADNAVYNLPWERFSAQGGYLFSRHSDQVTVGSSGLGAEIDVEDNLGLKVQNQSFRFGTYYRIGEARRHRVDLQYYYFNRSGEKTVADNILVGGVTIPAGTLVKTTFNVQMIKAAYSYSFFQDDRMDLAASIGLFLMPLKYEVTAVDVAGKSRKRDFATPLPTIGVRGDFAVAPRLFLRSGLDLFYLKYQNFTGGMMDANLALDYNPWKKFGVGIGLEHSRTDVKAEGKDDSSLDVKVQFTGINIYVRYFF